jgi:hypothetical protein
MCLYMRTSTSFFRFQCVVSRDRDSPVIHTFVEKEKKIRDMVRGNAFHYPKVLVIKSFLSLLFCSPSFLSLHCRNELYSHACIDARWIACLNTHAHTPRHSCPGNIHAQGLDADGMAMPILMISSFRKHVSG